MSADLHDLFQYRRQLNVGAVVITVAVTVLVTWLCLGHDDGPGELREIGLWLMTLYSLVHLGAKERLEALPKRADPTSRVIVFLCDDPRRITNLDLAAYWGLFAVVVPRLLID